MKFEIKNRWNGNVQFVAEIDAPETASIFHKIGKAVKWAFANSANLSGANLSAAKTPHVPPVVNLDGRILTAIEAGGELKMDSWHQCETTHCRAGWAVALSPVGKTLESIFGTNVAGALIYNASYPDQKVPNFFASNEAAMTDIKARAAQFTAV